MNAENAARKRKEVGSEPTSILTRSKTGKEVDKSAIVAIALLMLRVAKVDHNFTFEEASSITHAVRTFFNRSAADAALLVSTANERLDEPESLEEALRIVNSTYTTGQRRTIYDLCWQVADSDARMPPGEASFTNSLLGLLRLTTGAHHSSV